MVVRCMVRVILSKTWASNVFLLTFMKFSILRAKIQYFEVKIVSQPSQCLTWTAAKKFSERLQWTTGVSWHFFRIISTHKSKRNDHTTIISISNHENVSYCSFCGVQKSSEGFWRGFCEEFSKNTPKSGRHEKTSRLQSTWKNFLCGCTT